MKEGYWSFNLANNMLYWIC